MRTRQDELIKHAQELGIIQKNQALAEEEHAKLLEELSLEQIAAALKDRIENERGLNFDPEQANRAAEELSSYVKQRGSAQVLLKTEEESLTRALILKDPEDLPHIKSLYERYLADLKKKPSYSKLNASEQKKFDELYQPRTENRNGKQVTIFRFQNQEELDAFLQTLRANKIDFTIENVSESKAAQSPKPQPDGPSSSAPRPSPFNQT